MKANDLRAGMAVTLDGKLYVCVHAVHVTPGNLRAFVQAKLRCLADGMIIEKRLRSTEELDQAFLDRTGYGISLFRQFRSRPYG